MSCLRKEFRARTGRRGLCELEPIHIESSRSVQRPAGELRATRAPEAGDHDCDCEHNKIAADMGSYIPHLHQLSSGPRRMKGTESSNEYLLREMMRPHGCCMPAWPLAVGFQVVLASLNRGVYPCQCTQFH